VTRVTPDIPVTVRPVLVDKKTAAQMLGISLSTVNRMIDNGEIGPVALRGRVLFRVDELERFAAELPSWEPAS
jgi:excisionase family DNA binding protein